VSPERVLERRKNRTVQSFQSLRDQLLGTVASSKDGISDSTRSAVDTITSTPDAVRAQTQGSPLATGAIGWRLQLAFVTDERDLAVRVARSVDDPGHVECAGHRRLVDDHHSRLANWLSQPFTCVRAMFSERQPACSASTSAVFWDMANPNTPRPWRCASSTTARWKWVLPVQAGPISTDIRSRPHRISSATAS
jgi:hypothetical protein